LIFVVSVQVTALVAIFEMTCNVSSGMLNLISSLRSIQLIVDYLCSGWCVSLPYQFTAGNHNVISPTQPPTLDEMLNK